VGKKKGLMTD